MCCVFYRAYLGCSIELYWLISKYLFIAISQYCVPKCHVWIGPYIELILWRHDLPLSNRSRHSRWRCWTHKVRNRKCNGRDTHRRIRTWSVRFNVLQVFQKAWPFCKLNNFSCLILYFSGREIIFCQILMTFEKIICYICSGDGKGCPWQGYEGV